MQPLDKETTTTTKPPQQSPLSATRLTYESRNFSNKGGNTKGKQSLNNLCIRKRMLFAPCTVGETRYNPSELSRHSKSKLYGLERCFR